MSERKFIDLIRDSASRDINQYFPQKSFTAFCVFVLTWKYGPQQSPAGFDTINSTYHFVIPGSNNGNYQNLKNTSNHHRSSNETFSDLTQSGNVEAVLQKIEQELFSHGLSSSIEMKLRKVKRYSRNMSLINGRALKQRLVH